MPDLLPVPGVQTPSTNPQQPVTGLQKLLQVIATNPNVRNALLTTGASLLQPRRPGQSQVGAVGQGLLQGLNTYSQGKESDLKKRYLETQIQGQEQSTAESVARTERTLGQEARDKGSYQINQEIMDLNKQLTDAKLQQELFAVGKLPERYQQEQALNDIRIKHYQSEIKKNLESGKAKSPKEATFLALRSEIKRVNPELSDDQVSIAAAKAQEAIDNSTNAYTAAMGAVRAIALLPDFPGFNPDKEKMMADAIAGVKEASSAQGQGFEQATGRNFNDPTKAAGSAPPPAVNPAEEQTLQALEAQYPAASLVTGQTTADGNYVVTQDSAGQKRWINANTNRTQ